MGWTGRELQALIFAIGMTFLPSAVHAQDGNTDPTVSAPVLEYQRLATPRAPVKKSDARLEAEAHQFAEREQACARGSAAACGELGEAYELGIGTPQNRPIAAILYADACDAGDAASCYRSGSLMMALADEGARAGADALYERACTLGSLDGCAALARSYDNQENTAGASGVTDGMADRLARETCERGGGRACRDIAYAIEQSDPDKLREAEVAGLLYRACVLGEVLGCTDLADDVKWGMQQPGIPSEAELLRMACELDDPGSCLWLGDIRYRGDGSYIDPEAALAPYDRACYLEPDYLCQRAENLRAEPVEYAACQNDDAAACARLAEIYSYQNTPLYDPDLSRAYYEYACYAGATEACARAGSLVLDPAKNPDAGAIMQGIAYLERGCAAEELGACRELASHLKIGEIIPQDMDRYWQLAARLCSGDWFTYCEELERAYPENPDLPLIEAGTNFIPPIEEGDTSWRDAFLTEEEREFERTRCATSEIEFRGQVYSDTICIPAEAVIGGDKVDPGDAPWQALIWRPERAFGVELYPHERVLCGGSLIATGWILTAAHCLTDDGGSIKGRGYTVRLGVLNPRENEGVSYPITQTYRHPQYNPDNRAFDIALIRYNSRAGKPAPLYYAIRSIAIDRKAPDERPIVPGQPTYVYGWGWERASNGTSSAELRSAKLLLESQALCNSLSGLPREQWNTKLCAAGANREQACLGDSGGPLITYTDADRRPRVIGVVSSGNACGQTGKASRYIRVASALGWIDSIVR